MQSVFYSLSSETLFSYFCGFSLIFYVVTRLLIPSKEIKKANLRLSLLTSHTRMFMLGVLSQNSKKSFPILLYHALIRSATLEG